MEAETQPLDFSNRRSPPQTSNKRKVEKLEAGQNPSPPPPPPEELASNQSPVQAKKKKRVGSNSSRERLAKHGFEVAEQPVRIPDQWGQESLLKDWIDCSVFDTFLVPGKISSARAALMEERPRAANNHHHSHSHSLSHSHSGGGIVLHNSC